MHLVGFIIRIYHDERSPERQTSNSSMPKRERKHISRGIPKKNRTKAMRQCGVTKYAEYLYNNVNKNPTDATVCRYLFTAKLLYMFQVSQHPSSGVLKAVPATSGTCHTTCTATPLQRGQIRTGLCESSRLAQTSPDQSTLEGSSSTSSMTCTGGCGYSF